MTAQRGRKRGPYKPRVPKVPVEPTHIGISKEPTPEGDPVPAVRYVDREVVGVSARGWIPGQPGATTDEPQMFTHLLATWEPPAIRFVRFRWGVDAGAHCVGILTTEGTIAVLIPPSASIAAGASLYFRAPDGGWSFAEARPGDDIGQYLEV